MGKKLRGKKKLLKVIRTGNSMAEFYHPCLRVALPQKPCEKGGSKLCGALSPVRLSVLGVGSSVLNLKATSAPRLLLMNHQKP